MNRHGLLSLLSFICAFAMNAQVVKPVASTPEDYITLLNSNGYESYSFDISSLSDSRYKLSFKIMEYVDGQKVSEILTYSSPAFENMVMVSDFDERDQALITPEEMAVPERGIFRLADRISIGFAPSDNDSIKTLIIDVKDMGTRGGRLVMKPVTDPETGKSFYLYGGRIFKPADIKEGDFVPLVLFGSYWFDKNFNIFRYCGENELSPDLSDNIIKNIPSFYLIGVQIEPSSKK